MGLGPCGTALWAIQRAFAFTVRFSGFDTLLRFSWYWCDCLSVVFPCHDDEDTTVEMQSWVVRHSAQEIMGFSLGILGHRDIKTDSSGFVLLLAMFPA
jgi:hypothetical protein